MAEIKCAHEGCLCEVKKPDEYCSAYCSGSHSDGACQCGHPACEDIDATESETPAGDGSVQK